MVEYGISHDRADDSPKVRARWFKSLTVEQRLDMWTEFYNLAIALNPALVHKDDDVRQTTGPVQVLELPKRLTEGS